jgi:hypothetical protein
MRRRDFGWMEYEAVTHWMVKIDIGFFHFFLDNILYAMEIWLPGPSTPVIRTIEISLGIDVPVRIDAGASLHNN